MSFLKKLMQFFLDPSQMYPAPTKIPPVCPSCHKALTLRPFATCRLYACDLCNGLWLTPDVFKEMLELPEDQVRPFLEIRHDAPGLSPLTRTCPGCDSPMDRAQFHYSSGIWIDTCPNNHGVWLDGGELAETRNFSRQQRGEITAQERKIAFSALGDAQTKFYEGRNRSGGPWDTSSGDYSDAGEWYTPPSDF
jgi:Zn-finger nucleic acid-binding protein